MPGRTCTYYFSLFLCFLLLRGAAAADPPHPWSEEALFEFAHHLLQEKDFEGAAVEFKRYLFLYPAGTRADQAEYELGEIFFRKKEYAQALHYWEEALRRRPNTPFKNEILFASAKAYWAWGREERALSLWETLVREGRPPFTEMASRALLWALVKQKRFDRAQKWLEDAPLTNGEKEIHSRYLAEAKNLPRVSPTAAGLLAAFLPGAGHWYLERKQDALIAFIVNGLFAWAAVSSFQEGNKGLGVLLTAVELAWYSGNIYSAVNSAHKENRKRETDFLNNYGIRFGFLSRSEKGVFPIIAFHIPF